MDDFFEGLMAARKQLPSHESASEDLEDYTLDSSALDRYATSNLASLPGLDIHRTDSVFCQKSAAEAVYWECLCITRPRWDSAHKL